MNILTADPADGAPLATRRFAMVDQQAFAALSGDANPMHMDMLAARRTEAGEPAVHGVHAVLWVLECLAKAELPLTALQNLRVQFRKFMYLDRELVLRLTRIDTARIRATVLADGLPVMVLSLRFGARIPAVPVKREPAIDAAATPEVLSLDQMHGRAGWLLPPVASEAFASLFPEAEAALGANRLSGLAQLSRLVGMVCPGLYSIFSGFAVDLIEAAGNQNGIGYRVTTVDDRFRIIGMAFEGNGLAGQVSAFVRWPPVEAPGMGVIARHVQSGEFAATTALIAGGSRGLGAMTAKLIAAGGGRVIVTYVQGRADAERLMAEINVAHGPDACSILAFDAMQPVAPQLGAVAHSVTQLYYFATPRIFIQKPEQFSYSLFARFSRVYIEAFHEICCLLQGGGLSAFYPSSVAVEARPKGMVEYSMAKLAGEMLCAEMMQTMPGLSILISRLPRVLTDQTATVTPVANADPLEVMPPLIRAVHALSQATAHPV